MITLLVLARAFHFGSALILAGVVAFRWLVLLPGFARESEATWNLFAPLHRLLRLILIGAFVTLLASGALWFWEVTADMSGTSLSESLTRENLGAVFFQTQFGRVTQWRIGLSVVWVLLTVWLERERWLSRRRLSWIEAIAGLAGFALVGSVAWIGHAGSGGPWWRVAADAGHLLAASIWPAGLLPFALFLRCAGRLGIPSCLTAVQATTARFSSASFITVALLIGTGMSNSYYTLGSFTALVTSDYGHILALKLFIFGLILGFAAANRYRLVPLTLKLSPGDPRREDLVVSKLRTFVSIEWSLALAVIAVVAILGTTPPPQ